LSFTERLTFNLLVLAATEGIPESLPCKVAQQ